MSASVAREELDELRRNLQKILRDFGPDYWSEVDRARAFPERCYAAMAEAGIFGTLIPERWGGVDAGTAATSVIVEEINRAGGDAAAINAQMAICGTLVRSGSDELRDRFLPGVATGEVRFLTVAATEPDSGADMTALESKARQDGDAWILDARKVLPAPSCQPGFCRRQAAGQVSSSRFARNV